MRACVRACEPQLDQRARERSDADGRAARGRSQSLFFPPIKKSATGQGALYVHSRCKINLPSPFVRPSARSFVRSLMQGRSDHAAAPTDEKLGYVLL